MGPGWWSVADALAVARALHALERDAQRAAMIRYLALRSELIAVLDEHSAAGLARQAMPLFDSFDRELRGALLGLAGEVEERAIGWASSEVGRLGADAGLAVLLSASARSTLRAASLQLAGSWVGSRRDLLVLESLASTQLDGALLLRRLLGRSLADGRVSIWRGGVPPLHLDIWKLIWRLFNLVWSAVVGMAQQISSSTWRREAVAVLDSKTTDCCRRIDGAVVGLFEPFRLTGTPRFADRMLDPPFHYFCRTLVRLRGEDEL